MVGLSTLSDTGAPSSLKRSSVSAPGLPVIVMSNSSLPPGVGEGPSMHTMGVVAGAGVVPGAGPGVVPGAGVVSTV